MPVEQAEAARPTVSLANIAEEVFAEVTVGDFQYTWHGLERKELAQRDPVLSTYLELAFTNVAEDRGPHGGIETAKAMRHGNLFAYRILRIFAEEKGVELPKAPNVFRIDSLLRNVPPRSQLSDPKCDAEAFSALYVGSPELLAVVDRFRVHAVRDGAGSIFTIFYGFLAEQGLLTTN